MGYYTWYALDHNCEDEDVFDSIVDKMEEIGIFEGGGFDANKTQMCFDTMDLARWYEWEADMREVSSAFPNVLFTLSGAGDDSGDLWKAYFVGGKMQYAPAQIVYDDFDSARLR